MLNTRTTCSGFTFVELLISLTLVSLLLVALVDSLQGFGASLESVEAAAGDRRLEESLGEMTRAARHAWLVEEPSDDVLRTTDAYGDATTFGVTSGELRVLRPSGLQGVLVDDVADFEVRTRTIQRLRPATDVEQTETLWTSALSGTAEPRMVEEVLDMALGFHLASEAPSSYNTVSGVQELNVSATLQTLELPLSFAPPLNDTVKGN